jgi:hypothetical protein
MMLLRRLSWPVRIFTGVVVLAVLLLCGALLAQGAEAVDAANHWSALNAIVNVASLVGGVITAAVAWVVRSINARLKRMADCLDAFVEWQREQSEATRTNLQLLATKQNGHEVACVVAHGPMPGRPAVPEVPSFEWPSPPQRRSTDRKTF